MEIEVNETTWFILIAAALAIALLMVLWIWWNSGPTELEEANQVGELGEHLAVLEVAATRRGVRATTVDALNRAIELIRETILRHASQEVQPTEQAVQQGNIRIEAPAGSNVIINPPEQPSPPQDGA